MIPQTGLVELKGWCWKILTCGATLYKIVPSGIPSSSTMFEHHG
jgi:hypothetical protein